MNETSSYRPHDPGHDYYAPGIYLITLVVRARDQHPTMFGHFNDDLTSPAVIMNDMGKGVMECWCSIPLYQARHGRSVVVHSAVCMPDHFHGVIEVKERMDVSVGEVICGFKIGCTQAWRRALQSSTTAVSIRQPSTAADAITAVHSQKPYMALEKTCPDLHRMSKRQRAAYYAEHPEAQQPLWDDNYDDTICLSDPVTGAYNQRHFAAMLRYVADNPRRAIVRRMRPDFMQRCLHVEMTVTRADGTRIVRDYAAFGNLFLLRWSRKVQVFCHRKARWGMLTDAEKAQHCGLPASEGQSRQSQTGGFPAPTIPVYADDFITSIPYKQTEMFRDECRQWKRQVMAGATVIVTPGISQGELAIKNRCLESGYPLIHLQKEPIGRYWKPEAQRFDACSRGALLILAPWKADSLGDVHGVPSSTDYAIFHNLNILAEEIVRFDSEARVINELKG